MSNFEKEIKDLIECILQNIAYCTYNIMYSSASYDAEIYNHECALSGLLTLADKCNIDVSDLRGGYFGATVSVNDYENYNAKKVWW